MTGAGRIWALLGVLVLTACAARSEAASAPSTTTTADSPTASSAPATSTTTAPSTTTPTAPEVAGAVVEADSGPAPSEGCSGSGTVGSGLFARTLAYAGVERSYLLEVPPGHDGRTPAPLVLDLHGLLVPPEVHAQLTGFSALGAAEGFVTVTPRGGTGSVARWERGDVAYLDALLDTVTSDLCIDQHRVYLSGMSNGALMASTLVCALPGRFAAVAPVAGIATPPGCETGPIPVITFHGTADQQVPFGGGLGAGTELPDRLGLGDRSVPERAAAWAARNGCTGTFHDTRVGPDVVRRDFEGCPEHGTVVLYVIEGGAHAWPGSALSEELEPAIGPSTTTVDATARVWDFFAPRQGGQEVS